jgi:putative transposase
MIAEYCQTNAISVVVIGDIRNIRKNSDLGHRANQKLHSLPYSRIYEMLSYKLALYGIQMIREKESYTSQCSPYAPAVSKRYADKKKRVKRGLYKDGMEVFNADATGAFNILRKYLAEHEKEIEVPVRGISDPTVIKAAV